MLTRAILCALLSKLDQAAMFLPSVPEAISSNIGWSTDYPDSAISWFFSVLPDKRWDKVKLSLCLIN
jgi:hypothetical protein